MLPFFAVSAADPRGFDFVDGVIHDQFFDVGDVTHAGSEVVVPFTYEDHTALVVVARSRRGKVRAAQIPLLRATLRIATSMECICARPKEFERTTSIV